eukprot:674692-Amphidinium_carterae.1
MLVPQLPEIPRMPSGRKASTKVSHSDLSPVFVSHIKEPDFTRYGEGKLDRKEILKHKALIKACLKLSPSLSFRVTSIRRGLRESAASAWWGSEGWVARWAEDGAEKLQRMFRHASQAIHKSRRRGFKRSWVNQLVGSTRVEEAVAGACLE